MSVTAPTDCGGMGTTPPAGPGKKGPGKKGPGKNGPGKKGPS